MVAVVVHVVVVVACGGSGLKHVLVVVVCGSGG